MSLCLFLAHGNQDSLEIVEVFTNNMWYCSVSVEGDRVQEYQNHNQDPRQTLWSWVFSLITSCRQTIVRVI